MPKRTPTLSELLLKSASEQGTVDYAIKLRDRLLKTAQELRIDRDMAKDEARRELREYDATVCDEAARLLQVLGTEVTRLREGVGCYLDGRISRSLMRHIRESWNGDAKKYQEPAGPVPVIELL